MGHFANHPEYRKQFKRIRCTRKSTVIYAALFFLLYFLPVFKVSHFHSCTGREGDIFPRFITFLSEKMVIAFRIICTQGLGFELRVELQTWRRLGVYGHPAAFLLPSLSPPVSPCLSLTTHNSLLTPDTSLAVSASSYTPFDPPSPPSL